MIDIASQLFQHREIRVKKEFHRVVTFKQIYFFICLLFIAYLSTEFN